GLGGIGSGVTTTASGVTAVPAVKSDISAAGNGLAGTGSVPSGVPGVGSGISAVPTGVTAVPADADSSGDSDDTVIEEAPGEAPPAVPRDVPRAVPAVPKDVPGAVPKDVPAVPGSLPAAPRRWQQEHQTLQELGEPLPRLAAVQDLLFWRDVRKSAVAFGASLVLLLSLATLSAVTVVAHVALALLSVTISLRVYKAVVQALQKSEEGHPFRAYLDLDVTLSPETFQAHAAVVARHLNRALQLLVHLFLVEDLVDSLEVRSLPPPPPPPRPPGPP
ncbi:reticulon-3-A-like, partial [Passer montanus]|uniref:reticulon-3-A-like n=1 Tax=Passer montanus TaxID=9160 RepID=UPI0019617315